MPLATRLRAQLDHLRAQLTLALIIPTALVGVLIGAPLIEGRRAALMAQEQRRAEQAGRAAALLFGERLRSGAQLVRLLADRQAAGGAEPGELRRFLAATRPDTPFTCLAVQDGAGRTLAQDGDCAAIQPAGGRASFQSPGGEGLLAQLAAPLALAGGEPGQLVGALPIDRGLVDAAVDQPDLELGVVAGGRSVASSLASRPRGPVQAEDRAAAELSVAGAPYLAHYTALEDLDGRPVALAEVLLPLAPVRAAQQSATLLLLLGLAVAVALALAIGWAAARRTSRVVSQLSQATTAIGQGSRAEPVRIDGPAEIRQLGQAIETVREQLERSRGELEAEKQRYADILESIDEAVLTVSPSLEVTSINRGGELMLGCPREAAVGRPLTDLVRPDGGRRLSLTDIPRHGAARLAVRTAGQQPLTVTIARAPTPRRDEQVLVISDVSEDAALRELKDAFLANITHEFRTPLAAQIASLEILREGDGDLTPAERTQMLDALHAGVQRLDMLVQNLLESATIEAGYFRVDPEPCRAEVLVREAAELMRPLLRQRQQEIQLAIAEGLPPVYADGQRVVQVLVNLLANASKFGPYGDTIGVAVAAADGWVQVRVSDHGPGVAEHQREHLFERFARPGTATVPAQGAGLGLAIVKAIVDRHGGAVAVAGGPGSGTAVTFTLPTAEGGAR